MSTPMKDYFLAGLAVEEAIERRDRARANLKEAAAKVCPDELRALESASDGLKAAEGKFAHVIAAIMKGQMGEMQAAARKWAEDHAANCDDPSCEIKQAMQREREARAEKGGGLN